MSKILLLFFVLILSGCAGSAPPRAEYTNIPPLDKGWSRVFISPGKIGGMYEEKYKNATGPVYINDQIVGSTAYQEYFVVDLRPGSYVLNWIPDEPDKFYSEKKGITLNAGEVHYFTCDIEPKGAGWALGLVGYALSDYLWRGWLTETPSIDSKFRSVAYRRFNGSSNSNAPDLVVNHINADVVPANVTTNNSVPQKLRDLQALRRDGVITEDEFQTKKRQLLEKM